MDETNEIKLDDIPDLTADEVMKDANVDQTFPITLLMNGKKVKRKVTFKKATFAEMSLMNRMAKEANDSEDIDVKKRYWQTLIMKYSVSPKFENADQLDALGFDFVQHFGRLIEVTSLKNPFL